MINFKSFLFEATLNKDKYLIPSIKDYLNGKEMRIGADGKNSIVPINLNDIEKLPFDDNKKQEIKNNLIEIQKIYDIAIDDIQKAFSMLKDGKKFKKLFCDKKTGECYRWNQLYKGTYSQKGKNLTNKSNTNEVFTLVYLAYNNILKKWNDVFSFIEKNLNSNSKIKNPYGKEISFKDLQKIIMEDDLVDEDLQVAFNNAKVILKDIKNKTIQDYFWVYRKIKSIPFEIHSKNPSDIVLQFFDGTFLGYSLKKEKNITISKTSVINSNIVGFFKKNNLEKISMDFIDNCWRDTILTLKNNDLKKYMLKLPLKDGLYSEGGKASCKKFNEMEDEFKKYNLKFRQDDFYYKYRECLINSLMDYLKHPYNLYEFLQILGKNYLLIKDDVPYKKLLGSIKGSKIEQISKDEKLNFIFNATPQQIKDIKFNHKKMTQNFLISFKVNDILVSFQGELRTRTNNCESERKGGWIGRALYFTIRGLKVK